MKKTFVDGSRRIKTRNVLAAIAGAAAALAMLSVSVIAGNQAENEKKRYYKNGPSPMDGTPETVSVETGSWPSATGPDYSLSLDGEWLMTDSGNISELAAGKGWNKAVKASVPGSIYTALYEARSIADPYIGDNMKTANDLSSKNWYLKREFTYDGQGKRVRLDFEGLCNVADIYLNGKKIGSHEGMFGGPYIDVTDTVKKGSNTLVVRLHPAKDYTKTVVFNCSYGWHYAKLYPLGIWQSVSVNDIPSVTLDSPFITTTDYTKGTVDLAIQLNSNAAGTGGKLTVGFIPKNFSGKASYFTVNVSASQTGSLLRYRCDIPDPKLWWPGGYGEQNLYELRVVFEASDGSLAYSSSEFGIRQLEYQDFPKNSGGGYNRQFVINGVKVYMKGAGWCTIDAMMRFTREDYDRILSRARDAGINYLRAWGGGLVETDEFYDLCDEYGICVYQEWPVCWDSTKTQPANVLYETVVLGAKRLRNRPSLVVWGGGNEGEAPYSDTVMNNIGKLTYETDGTRDFWRQDGGTGSSNIVHDHIWWSGLTPEHYITTYSNRANTNMHEYGLGAMMNRSSIEKFSKEEELEQWPLDPNGSVAFHTATFNGWTGWTTTPYGYDIDAHMHYAGLFADVQSLDDLIIGSQLSQAQADYPLAINSRIKAPYSSVNTIYKLNDNYPGASWSIVDWYGTPKIAYYLMQDAYRPVMAAFMADHYNTIDAAGSSSALSLPVYILDDTVSLKNSDTSVTVTAFDSKLNVVKKQSFSGKTGQTVNALGNFELTAEETASTPLFIAADLYVGGSFVNRTYMYFNYEYEPGCIFYLPRTTLDVQVSGNTVTVKNDGSVPAIGVALQSSDESAFVCGDSYFMLLPGETAKVEINDPSIFTGVTCFNQAKKGDNAAPKAPEGVASAETGCDSVTVSWNAPDDESGIFSYTVELKSGDKVVTKTVHGNNTRTVVGGLDELTEYSLTVTATDNSGNVSKQSGEIKIKTSADKTEPRIANVYIDGDGRIAVGFSTRMEKASAENTAHYLLNNGATVTGAELSDDGYTVRLKADNFDASKPHKLCVIGVTDTKKNRNMTPYTELTVDSSLYLSVDFETDAEGKSYTGGLFSGTLAPVTIDPVYTEQGHTGKALDVSGGNGAKLEKVPFTFNEGSTVTMWVSGAAGSGYNVLLAKGPKDAGHFEFYTNSGKLMFYAPDIGDINLKYDLNKTGSGWRHLAFVFNSGNIIVYVNGQQVAKANAKGAVAVETEDISIGSLTDGSLPFTGYIDEIRFYERALTEEEISAAATGISAEAKPYIEGDDAGKALETDFVFGDGTAVNLWFLADSVPEEFAILFARAAKTTDTHFEIYLDHGRLAVYSHDRNGDHLSIPGIEMKDYVGAWHMLTVVRQSSKLTFYIDAKPVGIADAGFSLEAGKSAAYVGRLVEGGFEFTGKIAECELLSKAPDEDGIASMYKAKLVTVSGDSGLVFDRNIIWLKEGETAPLGLKVIGSVDYDVTILGDSVKMGNGVIEAVALGETVIQVRSGDGNLISAALVKVYDPATETPPSEGDDGPDNDVKAFDPLPLCLILIGAAVAACIVVVVVALSLKKKKQ